MKAVNTYIGSPVQRVEDLRFLRGRGQYIDDIKREVPEWAFVDRHGLEVLALVQKVDAAWRLERDREIEANKAKRRRESLEKKEQREEDRRQQKRTETMRRQAEKTWAATLNPSTSQSQPPPLSAIQNNPIPPMHVYPYGWNMYQYPAHPQVPPAPAQVPPMPAHPPHVVYMPLYQNAAPLPYFYQYPAPVPNYFQHHPTPPSSSHTPAQ